MYNSKKIRNKSTNKLPRVNSIILAQNRAPYFVFPKRESSNVNNNNNNSPMEEIRNNFFNNNNSSATEVSSSLHAGEVEKRPNNCLIPPPPIPVLKRFSYTYNLGAYPKNIKKEQMGAPFLEKWVTQQRQFMEQTYPNRFVNLHQRNNNNNNNNAPLIPQNGLEKLIPSAPRPIVKNWSKKIPQNIPDEQFLPTAPSSSSSNKENINNNSKSIFKEIDEKWMRRNSTFKLTEIGHSIKPIKSKNKPSSGSKKVQKEPSSTITSNALLSASANFTANCLYEDKIQQKIRANLLPLDENNMLLFKRYILKKSEEVNLILSGKMKKKEDPFDGIVNNNNNKQQHSNSTHHYTSTRHHKKSHKNRKFKGIPAKNWVYQTPNRKPYGSPPTESALEPGLFFKNNYPEEAGNSYAGNINKPTVVPIPINLIHHGKVYVRSTPSISDINFTVTSQDLSPSIIIDGTISPDFLDQVNSHEPNDEGKLFNFNATEKNFFR